MQRAAKAEALPPSNVGCRNRRCDGLAAPRHKALAEQGSRFSGGQWPRRLFSAPKHATFKPDREAVQATSTACTRKRSRSETSAALKIETAEKESRFYL